jgi:hypothetical protein
VPGVRITLQVHPRFGEEIAVIRVCGRNGVLVEFGEGESAVLPARWTSLVPREPPLTNEGRAVRLAPDAARTLAAWVRARLDERRKLGPPVGAVAEGSARGQGRKRRGHEATASMVEQARASIAHRGKASAQGGKR